MDKFVKCPKCKGSGNIYESIVGAIILDDPTENCPHCGGNGFLIIQ